MILGPKTPDAYEYDALLPGGGLLVWHIDESVIPLEYTFPLDTSLRVNPDFGVNTNPARLGISVIEADGLADLGDLGLAVSCSDRPTIHFSSATTRCSATRRTPI